MPVPKGLFAARVRYSPHCFHFLLLHLVLTEVNCRITTCGCSTSEKSWCNCSANTAVSKDTYRTCRNSALYLLCIHSSPCNYDLFTCISKLDFRVWSTVVKEELCQAPRVQRDGTADRRRKQEQPHTQELLCFELPFRADCS